MLKRALDLLVAAGADPRLAQYASLPLAMGFVTRPTNAVPIALLSLFVLAAHRRYFVRYVLWSLAVAVPFFALNLRVFGEVLPGYYAASRLGFHPAIATALAGNMVSPARGLFFTTPVLAFAVWGFFLRARRPEGPPRSLDWILAACIALHWVVISMYVHWWGGWSYGPRLMTDILPFCSYFLAPALAALPALTGRVRRAVLPLFAATLALSFFVHARGALSPAVHEWSAKPLNVDEHPERLWDLRDLPFLR